jgi:WD40 repeat protein
VLRWAVKTRQPLPKLPDATGPARGVAFAPDGRLLATAHEDGTLRFWSAEDGRLVVTHKRHRGAALAVAFAPDGRRAVTAGGDGTAKVWPVPAE